MVSGARERAEVSGSKLLVDILLLFRYPARASVQPAGPARQAVCGFPHVRLGGTALARQFSRLVPRVRRCAGGGSYLSGWLVSGPTSKWMQTGPACQDWWEG